MGGYEPSTYGDRIADVYDAWYGARLELGIGTGRVALPLAERGVDASGIDSSRYCWPAELDAIARLSGLELEERLAWYDRSEFDARSTRHVSVYRRP